MAVLLARNNVVTRGLIGPSHVSRESILVISKGVYPGAKYPGYIKLCVALWIHTSQKLWIELKHDTPPLFSAKDLRSHKK